MDLPQAFYLKRVNRQVANIFRDNLMTSARTRIAETWIAVLGLHMVAAHGTAKAADF